MPTRVPLYGVVLLVALTATVTAAIGMLVPRSVRSPKTAPDASPEFAGVAERRQLAWIDRDGRRTLLAAPPRGYVYPRLSPDGAFIAVDVRDGRHGLWLWDVARAMLSPLTEGGQHDIAPVWSRAGGALLFARGRGVIPGLFHLGFEHQPRSGIRAAAPMRVPVESNSLLLPSSLTPDDRELVVTTSAASGFDLLAIDLARRGNARPLLTSAADELNGDVSPDGRWLAYQSRASGQFEIWVKRWDAEGAGHQVTTAGGTRPVWTRGGRELVYLTHDGDMMALALDPGAERPTASVPHRLFTADIYRDLVGRTFDVSSNGERFLVVIGL